MQENFGLSLRSLKDSQIASDLAELSEFSAELSDRVLSFETVPLKQHSARVLLSGSA